MDLTCSWPGISAPGHGPLGVLRVLVPRSRTTLARSSSAEHKAASWNRHSCCTIAEISFEPPVTWFLPMAFLKTSMRRVASPTPSDRYTVLGPSSPLVAPDSTTSAVGSVSPDMAAHCLASRFMSSAERRSSWMLSTRNDILRGRACFCLSQMALISPDVSDKNDSHGTKIARCCTAALH
ncbi:hypothetical protein MPH_13843 [Macrophomina phaseolina MS6]|uniref:Uncharacterized protein n=1 Tax=Macrophomina phaseolina (strain MS6) TaxID=1126212 RepID=K2RGD7_MACPH|nr:hypothetical protein MPH_13843 [Macrophomina phaseolina MS6]